MYDM
jgi:actin